MTLMREATLSLIASGGCVISLRMPSIAVADAKELLVGLEVDVRRAGRDGVGQELLDVLDDGRVLDVGVVLDRSGDRRRRPRGRPPCPRDCAMSFSVGAARLDHPRDGCPSLSSSTTIGSGTRLVLKRTSSSACRLAGSEIAHEELVAALVQRQHAPRLRDLEIDVFLVDLVEYRSSRDRAAAYRRRARRTPRAAAPSCACRAAPARRRRHRPPAPASAGFRPRIRT